MKMEKKKEQTNETIKRIREFLSAYSDFITVLDVALCSIELMSKDETKKYLLLNLTQKVKQQADKCNELFSEIEKL